MADMIAYYDEVGAVISDPVTILYAWKIIERENIHRDEENTFASTNDKKSKVYDYNRTVEELASQDISKRNITYSSTIQNKATIKGVPPARPAAKKRPAIAHSDDRESLAQTEEDKERSSEKASPPQPEEQSSQEKPCKPSKREMKAEEKTQTKQEHTE